jgi:type I restriction enzyme M protein
MNTFENEKPLSVNRLEEISLGIIRGEEIPVKLLQSDYFSNESTNLRYLDLKMIEDGIIYYEELRSLKSSFIDYLNNLNSSKPVVEYSEELIIISRSAPFKVAFYENDLEKYPQLIASNNMYFIAPVNINPLYLTAFLDSDNGSLALDECKTGKSIKTLSLRKFRKMKVPRFTEEKELEIAQKYKQYLDEMEEAKSRYKKVKKMKDQLFN